MYIKAIAIEGEGIVQCEEMYKSVYIIFFKGNTTTINFKYVIEYNLLASLINKNPLANNYI